MTAGMTQYLNELTAALAGRYDIEREIGAGGMATVYLAHDVKHDRKVAVKVLRPDLAASLGHERFLREISIAAKLTHPHILPLYDSGDADGFLYFVMPFIEGESLRTRLSRTGELPVLEAVRLTRNVVDALALAHRHGIVHRDIKPDNVLLSDEHALVTDFGVAKAVTEATDQRRDLTTSGMAVGTPAYMSPEQAAGDPNIDHRADLYAVGCMTYEMLTGRPPFDGDSAATVLAAHVTEDPDPVQVHRSGIPEPVAEVVHRCLAKRPADRWQAAADLRAHIDSLTATGAITPAGAPSAQSAELAWRRSHPTRVMGLFAAAALGVVAVTYVLVGQLGLPSWVLPATVALLAGALPIVMLTGRAERRRASARISGATKTVRVGGLQDRLTWRRALTGGAVAFAGLGIAVSAYMGMRLMGIGPVGTLVASGVLDARDRIVLADFENRTTDSMLGATVTELLRIDLTQSPTVSLLDQSHTMQVLGRMARPIDDPVTAALAMEIATREGLKAVVTGEVLSVGSGYVVSSSLLAAADGAVLWVGRESANDPSKVIEAVDKLSASLRARIGESLRTIRAEAPLEAVTTGSTEALQKYAQADRANNVADFDRAIRLLNEAIGADSTFAMAYRKLGVILRNQNQDTALSRAAFTQAFQLRDQLTDRERYLAEAAYHSYVQEDDTASITVYEQLLEKYPDDRIALNNLSLNYRALGRDANAAELLVRAIALGNAPAATFTNALGTLYGLGLTDSASAVLATFAEDYPGHPQLMRHQSEMAAAQFEYAAAEEYAAALRDSSSSLPTFKAIALLNLASIANVRGRPAEALETIAEAFQIQEENQLGFFPQPWDLAGAQVDALLALRFFGGRDQAVAVLNRALTSAAWQDTDPAGRSYPAFAALYAEAGEVEQARELIRRYRVEVSDAVQELDASRAALHNARGMLALAEGNPVEALLEFRAWQDLVPGCPLCARAEIAMAYDAAGMADSAIVEYEQYLESDFLYRVQIDNVNISRIVRRLGVLYDDAGDVEKAVEYYNWFVDLWTEAEPALQPQVEQVRDRLAALTAR